MPRNCSCGVLLLSAMWAASTAAAETPPKRDFVIDPTGVSFALNVGAGVSDNYGFGFGGRAGYTFESRIYWGVFGGSHIGVRQGDESATVRKSTGYFATEVGYEVAAGAGLDGLLVRPVVGVGLGFASAAVMGGAETTRAKLVVAPGAELVYPIGPFFVGLDGRFVYMRDNSGVALMGSGGVHL